MSYLVDSDVFISVLQGDPETISLFRRLILRGVSMNAITYMEAYQGLLDQPASAIFAFQDYLRDIPVLPIDQEIAERCAYLRMTLANQGKRVRQRSLDLLIAATAIEHNLTLVTRNLADYRDVPGLLLFDHAS